MTITEIQKNSGLSKAVSESLYWHCIWLRTAPDDTKVMWKRLLCDKKYRTKGERK